MQLQETSYWPNIYDIDSKQSVKLRILFISDHRLKVLSSSALLNEALEAHKNNEVSDDPEVCEVSQILSF